MILTYWEQTSAIAAEVEDLRDVSRDALHLRSEVERLETLLATIGVDTRKRSTIASLRIETTASSSC